MASETPIFLKKKHFKSVLTFAENHRKMLLVNAVNKCFSNSPRKVNLLEVWYEAFAWRAESDNRFHMIFALRFLLVLAHIEKYLNKAVF